MAASSSTFRETRAASSLVTGQGIMPLHSRSRNPVSAKADLTNCVTLHQRFFQSVGKSCESMDCNLLIAYWILAGYLNPVDTVQKAYEKGNRILVELIQQGFLKYIPSARDEDVNKVLFPTDSDLNCCRHLGHCDMQNLDYSACLLSLNQAEKVTLTDGVLKDDEGSFILLDDDHLSRFAVGSLNRLKYVACFLPRWNKDSEKHLNRLFRNANCASVMLVRGRGLSGFDFSFEKLKTLTVLELSDISFFRVHEAIFTELSQLQCLKLSNLIDKQLPEDSFSKLKQLRCLILKHCSRLKALPSLRDLGNLEMLDLSHCCYLTRLMFETISSPKLYRLVLSWTALTRMPQLETSSSGLRLLYLNSADKLGEVDLSQHNDLEVLDLSYTKISSIDSMSDKVHLRELKLCGCKRLEVLPALEKLEGLAVLDVSGCVQLGCLPDLSNQRKLEVLDLSSTQVKHLPTFANPSRLQKLSLRGLKLDSLEGLSSLSSLVNLDLYGVRISSSEDFKVDFLGSLEKLQTLDLSRTSVAELPALARHVSLKELLLADCEHLRTLPDLFFLKNLEKLELPVGGHCSGLKKLFVLTNSSGDSKYYDEQLSGHIVFFELRRKLYHLISFVGKALEITTCDYDNTDKMQLKWASMDLEFIKKHVDRFKNSEHCRRAYEILQNLKDVDDWSEDAFAKDSDKLQQLVHTVAKLKILLPRAQTECSQSSETVKKNKESQSLNTNDIVNELVSSETLQVQMDSLLSSYKSLTNNEKFCLLCFSVFPLHTDEDWRECVLTVKNLEIKRKMLIYWWAGEGFINIHSEQVTSAENGKTKKTIEETGEDTLRVLAEKGFIQPVIKKGRETRRCRMNYFVHSFVTQQAKQEKYFNFSNKNGKLTPSLKSSQRACLLRSRAGSPSSCQSWAVYAKTPDKLRRFKMVKTLFNVDESVIHIQPEWFSEMKDLSVLYLGNWHSKDPEHIEVRDKMFLKDLKRMKQLKFFSLQGVSTIKKLPDSVCKLANLVILDLQECHDLKELPAGIGSLENLTHLDISNCHFLTKLPKGLRLLSKLEVLKGFVMYEQPGDLQYKKGNILSCSYKGHQIHEFLCREKNEVCTLRDLLNLQNLRKLSIVVTNENFPDSNELQVFKQMVNLHKLKISWRRNSEDDNKIYCSDQISVEQEYDNTTAQDQGDGMRVDKKPRREFLDQIEKLELWCFPNKTAPDWLVPDELQGLKKLYIRGGKLEKLPERSSSKEWNVTTLRLRYMPDLTITWDALRAMFPKMTYLDKCECKKLH